MNSNFDMVAKTFQGLEGVLAEELRGLGAEEIEPGKRMVAFRGDLAMLYRANMCCRTALRILKPFYSFEATDPDMLYARAKEYDWSSLMSTDQTFSIDSVVFSNEFRNSQYVTYRVKDAIVDWFRDRDEEGRRPRVCVDGADIMINVHVSGTKVTLSLDSSGESLHKRGWRHAQTEAPINEVLAAGIILMSGWDGTTPFVDPMCGSGTFVIEAAMIAAGINPGIYRTHFAFENWPDFDRELLEEIFEDDSREREVTVPILASDINSRAMAIARENAKYAGVEKYITFETKDIADWTEAPAPAGTLITNPPYGRRISVPDMEALYQTIGRTFKRVFVGWNCWVIGYSDEYFAQIGLAPSQKIAVNNGGLDCELREYVIFAGKKADFRAAGGSIKEEKPERTREERQRERKERFSDRQDRRPSDRDRKPYNQDRKPYDKNRKPDRRRFDDDDDESPRFEKRKERRRFDDETPRERNHRTFDLKRLGKKPSLPPEASTPLARPAWRKRKNKNEEE